MGLRERGSSVPETVHQSQKVRLIVPLFPCSLGPLVPRSLVFAYFSKGNTSRSRTRAGSEPGGMGVT